MRGRLHYADGRECRCDQKFSADPAAYVRNHPNKRGDDGQTFNDSVTETIRTAAR